MDISGGLRDEDVVVGNIYNKYGARNPFVRFVMRGFDRSLSSLVTRTSPGSIHEVGCGEGYWVLRWHSQGLHVRGSDFSSKVIDIARANARMWGVDPNIFETRNIFEMEHGRDNADLIVCLEVLEHLEHPECALRALQRVVNRYIIMSVPREPVWRVLNLLRGRYLGALGNTPGHIQHWSCRGFSSLVRRHFDIVEMKAPLPWTMLLCRARRSIFR